MTKATGARAPATTMAAGAVTPAAARTFGNDAGAARSAMRPKSGEASARSRFRGSLGGRVAAEEHGAGYCSRADRTCGRISDRSL